MVPAGRAIAFHVDKGIVIRLLEVEDTQVADATFFNANNYKEVYSASHSVWMNCIEGIGNLKRVKKLYSKPPRENVMLTVIEDTVGVHLAYIGTRCSPLIYKMRNGVDAPPHRTCQDNLAEAVAPFGLTGDDIPDIFNIFMDVDISPEGCFTFARCPAKKGDHIDMRAEMNLLAAISSCPQDLTPINGFKIKPLKVEIYE